MLLLSIVPVAFAQSAPLAKGASVFTATSSYFSHGDFDLGDLDGDGDLDFVYNDVGSGASTKTPIVIFNNGLKAGKVRPVDPSVQNLANPRFADLDGDSDLDILWCDDTYPSKLGWHENVGGGKAWKRHDLKTPDGARLTKRGVPIDLDADGDLDIYVPGSPGVVFDNVGKGTFEGLIDGRYKVNNTGYFYDSAAGDVDGDGRADLVLAGDKAIVLLSSSSGYAKAQDLYVPHNRANSIDVVDLDGDGDLDIAVGEMRSMTWLENVDGKGAFATEVFSKGAEVRESAAGDFDKDGDVDFVAMQSGYGTKGTVLFLQTDGELKSAGESTAVYWPERYQRARAADVDGDGDLDVVINHNSGLYMFRNDTIKP